MSEDLFYVEMLLKEQFSLWHFQLLEIPRYVPSSNQTVPM